MKRITYLLAFILPFLALTAPAQVKPVVATPAETPQTDKQVRVYITSQNSDNRLSFSGNYAFKEAGQPFET